MVINTSTRFLRQVESSLFHTLSTKTATIAAKMLLTQDSRAFAWYAIVLREYRATSAVPGPDRIQTGTVIYIVIHIGIDCIRQELIVGPFSPLHLDHSLK
jgi:hypothetical protein